MGKSFELVLLGFLHIVLVSHQRNCFKLLRWLYLLWTNDNRPVLLLLLLLLVSCLAVYEVLSYNMLFAFSQELTKYISSLILQVRREWHRWSNMLKVTKLKQSGTFSTANHACCSVLWKFYFCSVRQRPLKITFIFFSF